MSGEHESEDDVDIYGDLPNFPCLDDTVKELEESRKVLENEVTKLREKLKEVTAEKSELDSKNKSLSLNISTLYKTATAEIERKDRLIADLRKEKDAIVFRRNKNAFSKKTDCTTDNSGDLWGSQDTIEQNNDPAPDPELHLYQPEVKRVESEYIDADSSSSHKLTSHTNHPPKNVCTVFSRRRLLMTAENKNLDKPNEYINQESAVQFLNPEQYKDINGKELHNSTNFSNEYDSFSQSELKRDLNKSESSSNISTRKDIIHSGTKSEKVPVKRNKYNIDNSQHTLPTLSKEPISRHFHQRDECKSYSKYRAERYSPSESESKTQSILASEHHSRWQSYKIPRTIRETSVSRALRSLRSRSVSQSRAVPRTVENIAKGRYDVRTSLNNKSSTETDNYISRALKVSNNDPSSYHLKTQLPTGTQSEISKDLSCKKLMQSSEQHSVTGTSSVKFESSLKMPETELRVKIQTSPGSMFGSASPSVMNLSEHCSFKRSVKAKIVKLNSEIKLDEARNSVDNSHLVKNKDRESNEIRGLKRPLESKETDEAHLPDSKRQALDDITGRECYNYMEDGKSTSENKQKYNGTSKITQFSNSVSENVLKSNKFGEDESDGFKNEEITVPEERNKGEEQKEVTEVHINLSDIEEGEICEDDDDDKHPSVVHKKETSKSDSTRSNERDKNIAKQKDTEQQHGDHSKLRSDRKSSDTKRKTSGSFRPQHMIKRYRERSCTPIRFNSHCKRRSPSELLSKNRTGRRLSNRDEKARNVRSRSRSFEEGTTIYRGSKKYKIIDSIDEGDIRYKATGEERKKSKYSKDENKKSSSSQNCKDKKERHEIPQVEVDSAKRSKISRREEVCNRGFKNMCLLETKKDNSVTQSRVQDCSGQIEPMGRQGNATQIINNEILKSDDKELQHGSSIQPIMEPSDFNEMIKTDISENSHNSMPKSNLVELDTEITRSRSNNCEKERELFIGAQKNISSSRSDKKCVKYDTHKAAESEIEYTKCSKAENKKSFNSENDKNAVEDEQTKVIDTKESKASRQEEGWDRSVQKENLLETKTGDDVTDDYAKGQTESLSEIMKDVIPDTMTETQKSDGMESSKQPVSDPAVSCEKYKTGSSESCHPFPVTDQSVFSEIIKTGSSENSCHFIPKTNSVDFKTEMTGSISQNWKEGREFNIELEKTDRLDGRCIRHGTNKTHVENERNKSSSSDKLGEENKNNERKVGKTEEKKGRNRKETKACRQREYGTCVQKTNNKDTATKSKIHDYKDPTESAVKKFDDSIPTLTDDKKTDCEVPQDSSSKQLISEQAVSDGIVNIENESMKTEFRDKTMKKSFFEEDKKNKIGHKTDKNKTNKSHIYKVNKKKDEQIEVDNSGGGMANRKEGGSTRNFQQISLMKESKDDTVIKSELQDDCNDQSAREKLVGSSITNEKQISDFKELQPRLSKQPITDKVNQTEKTQDSNTKSRSKQSVKESRMLKESKMYETSHNFDGKCLVYRTKKSISEEERKKNYCERIEKTSDNFQKLESREQNDECGTEAVQMEMGIEEERKSSRKEKFYNTYPPDKNRFLEAHEDVISNCKMHNENTVQTESPVDRMEDAIPGTIQEKSDCNKLTRVLPKHSVAGPAISDEVNKISNENVKKGRSRTKSNKEEGRIHTVSEKYKMSDNQNQRGAKYETFEEEKNEKVSTISQNHKGNKEEIKQSGIKVSQTDMNTTKAREERRRFGDCSKNKQQMCASEKNKKDRVMKSRIYDDCIDEMECTVDRVKDVAPSVVNKIQKSYSDEFKRGSSKNHASKPSTPNENEKNKIIRSRSRSCEEGSALMGEPEKHKMTDQKCVRSRTNRVKSEEERNENRYSKDKNKKLSHFQNCKENMENKEEFEIGITQIEEDNKGSKATEKEEGFRRNVSLLETNKEDGSVKPRILDDLLDDCKGQKEIVERMKDARLKEKFDFRELHHGKCNESITELSGFNEIIKMGTAAVTHKYFFKDNSGKSSESSFSKVSPVVKLKFRARRSMELEDSKAVLSVNITPPKEKARKVESGCNSLTVERVDISAESINSVSIENKQIVQTKKSNEDRDNRKNLNVSCNNGSNSKDIATKICHSMIVGDNKTAAHKSENISKSTKNVTPQLVNTHNRELKTDLDFRRKYENVFSHESNGVSEEGEFDSSSSSSDSDQNSDESWNPKKGQTVRKNKTKSQQNKQNIKSKTKCDRKKSGKLS